MVGLPKQSGPYEAIKWALDRLAVDTVQVSSTEAAVNACIHSTKKDSSASTGDGVGKNSILFNNVGTKGPSVAEYPNLVIIDARATKIIDFEKVAR